MNSYAGTPAPPGGMYVRALYDYDADDRTSLSFRKGQLIRVITQLESGWWDGIINNVRGWFPSNYCQVLTEPVTPGQLFDSSTANGHRADDAASNNDGIIEYDELYEDGLASEGDSRHNRSRRQVDGQSDQEQESNKTGLRARTNAFLPESNRPPPEIMAGGRYEREDDTDYDNSASENEGVFVEESTASLVGVYLYTLN
jgi:son of sevenless-like protein